MNTYLTSSNSNLPATKPAISAINHTVANHSARMRGGMVRMCC
ncbi:hypothetical protein [Parapedobacter composti]|nr:hypothetical protein [Parapedobacter composti]